MSESFIREFRFTMPHSIAPPFKLAIVLMVLLGQNARAQSDAESLQKEWDDLQPRCYEAKMGEGLSYSLIELPPPISRRDIDRYSVVLRLSEAQLHNLERLFDRYTEAERDIINRSQAALNDAAEIMMRDSDQPDGMVRAYAQLQEVVAPVRAQLRAAEEALYSELANTLAPSQLDALPRVRMHRSRQDWIVYSTWVSANQIDLSDLIDISCRGLASPDGTEELRWEYEQARTTEVKRLIRHWTDHAMANVVAMARVNAAERDMEGRADSESQQVLAAARAERHSILENAFEAEGLILSVNRRFFPKFLEVLPPECRDGFRQRYLVRAYPPEFLVDPNDPSSLVRSILANEALPHDVKSAIESLCESHNARWEQFLDTLCRDDDEWVDRYIRLRGTASANRAAYDQKRFAVLRKRLDANTEYVKSIVSLLPPELALDVTSRVDDYMAKADRQSVFLVDQEERAREMVETLREIGD